MSGGAAQAAAPAPAQVLVSTVAVSSSAVQAAGAVVSTAAVPAAAVLASTPIAAPKYHGPSLDEVYWMPDGARDPFAEVSVRSEGAASAAKQAARAKNAKFTLASLELVGIISTTQGLQAILADRESGLSYSLMRGLVYDRKHQVVQNYSGVVNGREVILYGPGKAEKKLKLPEKKSPGKLQ